jgi:hypothetical protein
MRSLTLSRSLVSSLAAALILSGCSTLMPGASDKAEIDASAGTAGDVVKVVFVNVDLKAVADITGFKVADAGDAEAQVQALEDWVNANGGVGGKRFDAVYRRYDASLDSPAAEEALCKQITQDDRAFAVVLDGQFQDNARPCYADGGTIMLDATLVATDAQQRDELSPYLWSPTFPDYDDVMPALIKELAGNGFFDGRKKAGVVVADTPPNRRLIADVAEPLFESLGIVPEVAWVDTTDQGTLFQGNDAAAVTFRTAKIDRVVFLGGARLGAIFTTVAAAQSYEARYSISSIDSPQFFQNNPETIPPAALKGMIGIGSIPALDVSDAEYSFPQGKAEKQCLKVFSDADITFSSREAARVALPYCDAARMFKLAADAAVEESGELTAQSWAQAAGLLGDSYVSAGAFRGGYRVLKYVDACRCFTYSGPVREFG